MQGFQSGIIKWRQNITQRYFGIGMSNAYSSSENYILAAPYSFQDNLKGCARITYRTRLTQISGCRFASFDSTYNSTLAAVNVVDCLSENGFHSLAEISIRG